MTFEVKFSLKHSTIEISRIQWRHTITVSYWYSTGYFEWHQMKYNKSVYTKGTMKETKLTIYLVTETQEDRKKRQHTRSPWIGIKLKRFTKENKNIDFLRELISDIVTEIMTTSCSAEK